MLKNSLFQPSLSFCFSALIFLSSFLVSALSLFCSALFLPFLFQHFFSFVSLFQPLPFFFVKRPFFSSVPATFFCFSVPALSFFQLHFFFFFIFNVLPYFFSPKHFFSPNTFSAQEHFQPKTFFSPLLFICGSTPPSIFFFFCSALLFLLSASLLFV